MALIGVALLPLVAEALKETGDDTVAPLPGEVTVMPEVVGGATVPTVIVSALLYDLPLASHATIVTLWFPFASEREVLKLEAFTVYLLTLST
ncbi:MAG TPA: hypothetical protein VMU24_09130 [Candidatus Acidoferrales bacterium]|nr:hypothetical protein [Candidatus Acidoferrales bacterium]